MKQKKPIYKRKWFIILVIILVLGLAGSVFGDGDKGKTTNTSKSSSTTQELEKEESATQPTESEEESVVEKSVEDDMTSEQRNAYHAAQKYLEFMPFSKQGLIDQLSSEYGDQYPVDVATFAVETLEAEGLVDWNEQAEKAARNYLDTMSFSKDGLIEQLESEYGDQFTHEQAVEGVERAYEDE